VSLAIQKLCKDIFPFSHALPPPPKIFVFFIRHIFQRYAIEGGTFDVFKEGVGKIAEMKPGQTFGELALLYGAKRSATVTCTNEASLWALDRSTFRFYQTTNERRMKDTAVDVLRQVPLLKDLDPDQLQKVADVATTSDFREGDVIIRKGEIGNTFFIVLEGVVVCTDASMGDKGEEGDEGASAASGGAAAASSPARPPSPAANPKRSSTAQQKTDDLVTVTSTSKNSSEGIRLKAGDWFGEIALLTGSARTANVMADSSVRLLAFDRDAFEKVLGSLQDLLNKKANMRMLAAVPIIAKLPDRERNAAFEMFDTEVFKAGSVVVREGTPGTRFYLVRSGTGVVTRLKTNAASAGTKNSMAPPPSVAPSKVARRPPPPTKKGSGAAGGGAVRGSGGRAMPPESFDGSFESLSSFDMAAASKQAGGGGGGRQLTQKETDGGASASSGGGAGGGAAAGGGGAAPLATIPDVNPLLSEVETVGEIKMGDHFGEESLEKDTPRHATVTAVTDMSCFTLERADFEAILHEYEQFTAHELDGEMMDGSVESEGGIDASGGSSRGGGGLNRGEASFGDDAVGQGAKKRPPASHRGSYMPGTQGTSAQVSPAGEQGSSPPNKTGAKSEGLQRSGSSSSSGGGGGAGGSRAAAAEPSGPPPQAPPKEELEVDWGALKNLGKIGAGTFGTVLMMQDTRDNTVFAMKVWCLVIKVAAVLCCVCYRSGCCVCGLYS
jgi:CRP-like cAMP-binding protein